MENNRLGVIDSLSAGLNLIADRPWVIAIPVLLDLWYWLGPRLSVAPLFRQIEQFLVRTVPAPMPAGPIDINLVREMLDVLGQQSNLFTLLSAGILGVPSLMVGGSSDRAGVIEVHSWLVMAGLGAVLALAGLAIGCLYLTWIVQGLEEQPMQSRQLLRQAGVMWLRVVALVLLMLTVGVTLVVPFSLLLSILTFFSGGAASFLIGIFYMSIIWLGLYLYFVVYAMLINRVGPIQAIWNSVNVMARNFWSALGLIILILILRQGLSLVWQRLGEFHPIGMLIGIAAHSFIGSGLVAASLLFYSDRYRRWKQHASAPHGI